MKYTLYIPNQDNTHNINNTTMNRIMGHSIGITYSRHNTTRHNIQPFQSHRHNVQPFIPSHSVRQVWNTCKIHDPSTHVSRRPLRIFDVYVWHPYWHVNLSNSSSNADIKGISHSYCFIYVQIAFKSFFFPIAHTIHHIYQFP